MDSARASTTGPADARVAEARATKAAKAVVNCMMRVLLCLESGCKTCKAKVILEARVVRRARFGLGSEKMKGREIGTYTRLLILQLSSSRGGGWEASRGKVSVCVCYFLTCSFGK